MSKKEERANKRLIFYFTSRVLFMIIAIILISSWCNMFVHADSGSTLMSIFNIDSNKLNPDFTPSGNYSNNRAYFNSYDFGYAVQNFSDLNTAFDAMGNYGDPTNFHPPYAWDSNTEPLDFSDVDIDNNFIICCSNYFSGIGRMNGYIAIPKQLFLDGKVMFGRAGNIYATESFDYQISSTWQALTTRTFTADGSPHVVDLQQALNTSNCYFCSCPYWDGIGFSNDFVNCANDVLSHNNDPLYYTDTFCNMNYFMYDDASNMMDSFVSDVETESNANHMYFKDVQIGLTSQGRNMDVLESSVVIGCDVDDWVKNHIDDYYVYVSYKIHMKDSDLDIPDPSGAWSQYLPLRTFYNDAYTCGVYEIFQNIPVTGYTSFLSYYYHIQSTHQVETTNVNGIANGRGLFPSLVRSVEYLIGGYYTEYSTVSNYNIWDFGLEVRVVLADNPNIGSADVSGVYSKYFDFLHQSESIIKADGLHNNNLWLGESDPTSNPIVPQTPTGSGVSNGGSGGSSVNVQINDYGKVPINANTPEQIQAVKERYTSLTEYFNDYFYNLSQTQSNNNFLYFIGQTLPQIPGINFMIECAMLVFALAVILFVLKVLLF